MPRSGTLTYKEMKESSPDSAGSPLDSTYTHLKSGKRNTPRSQPAVPVEEVGGDDSDGLATAAHQRISVTDLDSLLSPTPLISPSPLSYRQALPERSLIHEELDSSMVTHLESSLERTQAGSKHKPEVLQNEQLERFNRALEQEAERLAAVQASDLGARMRESRDFLLKNFSDTLSATKKETLTESLVTSVEVARERSLLRAVDREAKLIARNDHRRSQTGGIDERALSSSLTRITERYRDVIGKNDRVQLVETQFKNAYSAERKELYSNWYNNLSWIGRRYHDLHSWTSRQFDSLTSFASDAFSVLHRVGKATIDAVSAAGEVALELTVDALKLAKDSIVAGASAIVQAGRWTIRAVGSIAKWCGDIENWQKLGSSLWGGVRTVGRGIQRAFHFLTSKETWTSVGHGLRSGYEFITSKETWQSFGKAIVSAGLALRDGTRFLARSIGNGIVDVYRFATSKETWTTLRRGVIHSVSWSAELAYMAITNPSAAWDQLSSALTTGWNRLGAIASTAWHVAAKCGVAAGHFLKGMSDDIGLTALVVGVKDLSLTPLRTAIQAVRSGITIARQFGALVAGEINKDQFKAILREEVGKVGEELIDGLKSGLRGIAGGIKLAGELIGFNDLSRAAYSALQGHWVEAGVYLGFAAMSAGSIIATVATAGTAVGSIALVASGKATFKAAAKRVLSTAAKEFFEDATLQAGEIVAKRITSTIGVDAQRAAAREVAEIGSQLLAEQVEAHGVGTLTTESVHAVIRDAGDISVTNLLHENDAAEIIRSGVLEALEALSKIKRKPLRAHLTHDVGLTRGQARRTAKEISKAMKTGKADGELIELYSKHITRETSIRLQSEMIPEFSGHFRRILSSDIETESEKLLKTSRTLHEATEEIASRAGRTTDEVVDEFVEAGERGFREGIQDAVERVSRDAVEKAFREFRKPKYMHVPHPLLRHGNGESNDGLFATLEEKRGLSDRMLQGNAGGRTEEGATEHGIKEDSYVIQSSDGDGNQILITMTYSPDQGKYVQTEKQVLSRQREVLMN